MGRPVQYRFGSGARRVSVDPGQSGSNIHVSFVCVCDRMERTQPNPIPRSQHMAPDLLFYPVPDEREALAGVSFLGAYLSATSSTLGLEGELSSLRSMSK